MLPSWSIRTALLLCLLVTSQTSARRSRIDLPIQNSADAPAEDNLATASGNESEILMQPVPLQSNNNNKEKEKVPIITEAASDPIKNDIVEETASVTDINDANDSDGIADDENKPTEATSLDNIPPVEECEPDNIGYEIVTG